MRRVGAILAFLHSVVACATLALVVSVRDPRPATSSRRAARTEPRVGEAPAAGPPAKFYAVHVGPGKAASSTLQESLRSNPFRGDSFAADRVIYVGKRDLGPRPDPWRGRAVREVLIRR